MTATVQKRFPIVVLSFFQEQGYGIHKVLNTHREKNSFRRFGKLKSLIHRTAGSDLQILKQQNDIGL